MVDMVDMISVALVMNQYISVLFGIIQIIIACLYSQINVLHKDITSIKPYFTVFTNR